VRFNSDGSTGYAETQFTLPVRGWLSARLTALNVNLRVETTMGRIERYFDADFCTAERFLLWSMTREKRFRKETRL
jgi:hypothetical protein